MNQEVQTLRDEVMNFISSNYDCCAEDADKEVLGGWLDEKLSGLVTNLQVRLTLSGVAAEIEADEDMEEDMDMEEDEDMEEEEDMDMEEPAPVQNMTAGEWLASAPPEIQAVVGDALKLKQQRKAAMIENMVGNVKGPGKTKLAERLSAKSLEELQELAALVPNRVSRPSPEAPSYFGAAVPVYNAAPAPDEILDLPVINWGGKQGA